jgi:hypothetical protein
MKSGHAKKNENRDRRKPNKHARNTDRLFSIYIDMYSGSCVGICRPSGDKMKDKKPIDNILKEYIKNAPTIGGFTIEELANAPEPKSCPACGRPYNDKIKH